MSMQANLKIKRLEKQLAELTARLEKVIEKLEQKRGPGRPRKVEAAPALHKDDNQAS